VQLVLVHDCEVVVEYLLIAYRRGHRNILGHIFRALATVLFENAGRTSKVTNMLILLSLLSVNQGCHLSQNLDK